MTITELYLSKRTALFEFANKIIHDPESAHDIVHNSFLYLLEHDTENTSRFIWYIVRNRCSNYLRDKKQTELPDINLQAIEIQVRGTEILYLMLSRLSKTDQAFMGLYLEGLSPQQMADELGVSNKRVRNRKSLILKFLKAMRLPKR